MCITLFCMHQNADAKITYNKSNGGWFGYHFVTTTDWGNGNIVVACAQPGISKCKAALAIKVSGDGPELSPETLSRIDETVMSLVINDSSNDTNNRKGKFIFDTDLFVTYDYSANGDLLSFTVYTTKEARDLNLI